MEFLGALVNFILHIDVHLGGIITAYGTLSYGILFFIIFAETGFVFTPFLPGDSLLFAAGAFSALGSLNFFGLLLLLILAAVAGDTVNYWIGRFFGQQLIAHPKVPINKEHIEKTHKFFAKYGGKTIILARFVPIVRTFAPFVAGVGKMHYRTFLFYNVIGGVSWVIIATTAGYFFGNLKPVKENFSLIILAIVLVSVLPMIIPVVKKKLQVDTI